MPTKITTSEPTSAGTTFAPTSTGTTFAPTVKSEVDMCRNDPLFAFKDDADKDCYWVGAKADSRCDKKLNGIKLSEYCPLMCGTCPEGTVPECQDEPDDTTKMNPNKTCAWLAAKPDKRCSLAYNGLQYKTYCPATCDSCGLPAAGKIAQLRG